MSTSHVCICLGREAKANKQAQTKSDQKNDISRNSCRLVHWEERRERQREGGEQLTRSDTGKRGDLIAQLAKSTGRKQQERLVPSVWPGSLCCFWWVPLWPSSPPFYPLLLPSSFPHCCLSRLTTSGQNDQLSPPHEHGSSW